MVSKCGNRRGDDWDQLMSFLVFAYNSSLHSSTQSSPFKLLYGRMPNQPSSSVLSRAPSLYTCDLDEEDFKEQIPLKLQMAWQTTKATLETAKKSQKKHYDRRHVKGPCPFTVGEKVFIERPGLKKQKTSSSFQGPFEITKLSETDAWILMSNKKNKPIIQKFHLEKLRKVNPALGSRVISMDDQKPVAPPSCFQEGEGPGESLKHSNSVSDSLDPTVFPFSDTDAVGDKIFDSVSKKANPTPTKPKVRDQNTQSQRRSYALRSKTRQHADQQHADTQSSLVGFVGLAQSYGQLRPRSSKLPCTESLFSDFRFSNTMAKRGVEEDQLPTDPAQLKKMKITIFMSSRAEQQPSSSAEPSEESQTNPAELDWNGEPLDYDDREEKPEETEDQPMAEELAERHQNSNSTGSHDQFLDGVKKLFDMASKNPEWLRELLKTNTSGSARPITSHGEGSLTVRGTPARKTAHQMNTMAQKQLEEAVAQRGSRQQGKQLPPVILQQLANFNSSAVAKAQEKPYKPSTKKVDAPQVFSFQHERWCQSLNNHLQWLLVRNPFTELELNLERIKSAPVQTREQVDFLQRIHYGFVVEWKVAFDEVRQPVELRQGLQMLKEGGKGIYALDCEGYGQGPYSSLRHEKRNTLGTTPYNTDSSGPWIITIQISNHRFHTIVIHVKDVCGTPVQGAARNRRDSATPLPRILLEFLRTGTFIVCDFHAEKNFFFKTFGLNVVNIGPARGKRGVSMAGSARTMDAVCIQAMAERYFNLKSLGLESLISWASTGQSSPTPAWVKQKKSGLGSMEMGEKAEAFGGVVSEALQQYAAADPTVTMYVFQQMVLQLPIEDLPRCLRSFQRQLLSDFSIPTVRFGELQLAAGIQSDLFAPSKVAVSGLVKKLRNTWRPEYDNNFIYWATKESRELLEAEAKELWSRVKDEKVLNSAQRLEVLKHFHWYLSKRWRLTFKKGSTTFDRKRKNYN